MTTVQISLPDELAQKADSAGLLKAQSLVGVTPAVHHRDAMASKFAMQARLDNGVVLDWTYDANCAAAQAKLLHTLAALPCFA